MARSQNSLVSTTPSPQIDGQSLSSTAVHPDGQHPSPPTQAVMGVATDTINGLDLSAEEKKKMIDSIPVAYAVTYIFGTAGTAWGNIANIAIFGLRDRQLQVLVDPERLRERQVTLKQVISTAGNAQLVSPLSFL